MLTTGTLEEEDEVEKKMELVECKEKLPIKRRLMQSVIRHNIK